MPSYKLPGVFLRPMESLEGTVEKEAGPATVVGLLALAVVAWNDGDTRVARRDYANVIITLDTGQNDARVGRWFGGVALSVHRADSAGMDDGGVCI